MQNSPVNRERQQGTTTAANSCLRIIVLGYFVRGPLGGMVWSNLQYMRGLARNGHDVYFVEDSDDYPSCYDPIRNVTSTDPTYGLQFTDRIFQRVGLGNRWAYHDAHTGRWYGPCADRILDICASADLLLNLCGMNPMRPWLADIPMRVLVDEDPAFTQIRHLTDPTARNLALQHTKFVSFAANIGLSTCAVPTDGFPWRPTRQPVVLDDLVVTPGPVQGKFTTVMLWQSYPAKEYGGVHYGMKSDAFQPYLELPLKTNATFELAVGGLAVPHDLLHSKGWMVRDPRAPTLDPWTYQHYVQESKAEFSVAKHGYVISRSGWFSERSVCYLAHGRPVLIQDTGFSDWLETGAGILAFNSLEEALAGVEDINSRYAFHCRAARAIAEEYFDARKVLSKFLKELGV